MQDAEKLLHQRLIYTIIIIIISIDDYYYDSYSWSYCPGPGVAEGGLKLAPFPALGMAIPPRLQWLQQLRPCLQQLDVL